MFMFVESTNHPQNCENYWGPKCKNVKINFPSYLETKTNATKNYLELGLQKPVHIRFPSHEDHVLRNI